MKEASRVKNFSFFFDLPWKIRGNFTNGIKMQIVLVKQKFLEQTFAIRHFIFKQGK